MYGRALQCRAARIKSNAQHIHIISYLRTQIYTKNQTGGAERCGSWVVIRQENPPDRHMYQSHPHLPANRQ
jgi:hypothetical protein